MNPSKLRAEEEGSGQKIRLAPNGVLSSILRRGLFNINSIGDDKVKLQETNNEKWLQNFARSIPCVFNYHVGLCKTCPDKDNDNMMCKQPDSFQKYQIYWGTER